MQIYLVFLLTNLVAYQMEVSLKLLSRFCLPLIVSKIQPGQFMNLKVHYLAS